MLRRASQLKRHLSAAPAPKMAASKKTPDITLYTAQTPNGVKISITLEELGCVARVVTFPRPLTWCS